MRHLISVDEQNTLMIAISVKIRTAEKARPIFTEAYWYVSFADDALL